LFGSIIYFYFFFFFYSTSTGISCCPSPNVLKALDEQAVWFPPPLNYTFLNERATIFPPSRFLCSRGGGFCVSARMSCSSSFCKIPPVYWFPLPSLVHPSFCPRSLRFKTSYRLYLVPLTFHGRICILNQLRRPPGRGTMPFLKARERETEYYPHLSSQMASFCSGTQYSLSS